MEFKSRGLIEILEPSDFGLVTLFILFWVSEVHSVVQVKCSKLADRRSNSLPLASDEEFSDHELFYRGKTVAIGLLVGQGVFLHSSYLVKFLNPG